MVNVTDVINWTDGPIVILTHAGTATGGWYGWIVAFSLWFLILFAILFTPAKKYAVAAASFPALIIAVAGLVFGWNNEGLVILMVILVVVGAAGGFVADR